MFRVSADCHGALTVKRLALSLLAAACLALPAAAGDGPADARALVDMPTPMRQHMLGNMRDHLLAMAQIQQALGRGAYDQAADIAEQRIGMSSLAAHGAAHMAPLMPQPMQDIGTQMHRAASRFARVAQESAVDGNLGRALGSLAEVTQQCVACHASYRIH